LKGNGQALEQKYALSVVFGDKCDPSANLLNQFNSHLVPCPGSYFYYYYELTVPAGYSMTTATLLIVSAIGARDIAFIHLVTLTQAS